MRAGLVIALGPSGEQAVRPALCVGPGGLIRLLRGVREEPRARFRRVAPGFSRFAVTDLRRLLPPSEGEEGILLSGPDGEFDGQVVPGDTEAGYLSVAESLWP